MLRRWMDNGFSLFYLFLNRQFSEKLNFALDLSLVFVDELLNIFSRNHILFIYGNDRRVYTKFLITN